ncbi:hypothetical protein [Variovorax sp. W6]|uniref:hypothetical protein n=1 Tax=Variovorax sp. W6 TaxID=3093895 RepID=UPI003D80A249
MKKLICGAALPLWLAVLASCGGGSEGSSTELPVGQMSSSELISKPAESPPPIKKDEEEEPATIQGLPATQADSLGGVAAAGAKGIDPSLLERAGSTDFGAVSARFIPNANARYLLLAPGGSAFEAGGELTASEQAASGAMMRLSNTSLADYDPEGGPTTLIRTTRDINGNATYALGRWMSGTVSSTFWIEKLSGTDYRNYHYLVFNRLVAWPTSGTYACDGGVFTSPTYLSGGPTGIPGRGRVTAASVTLTFDTYSAVINGTLNVAAGIETGTLNLSATPQSALTTPFVYSNRQTYISAALGDAGSNSTALIALGYITTLPSGSRYYGVARFLCS